VPFVVSCRAVTWLAAAYTNRRAARKSAERLVEQENVGQHGAQMNRGIEIVDELRTDVGAREHESDRAGRDGTIALEGGEPGLDAGEPILAETHRKRARKIRQGRQRPGHGLEPRSRALALAVAIAAPALGGIGEQVAVRIQESTEIETRTTVLGHVIRGGPPVAADRVLASQFGYHAMELLMQGSRNRMVVMVNGALSDVDIMHTVGKQRLVPLDHPLIEVARSVKTCFGD